MPLLSAYKNIFHQSISVKEIYYDGNLVWQKTGEVVGPAPGNIQISSTVLSAPTFPITISSNSRGLEDATGKPFYGIADTAWNAISRMSQADFTSYITTRRAQGYTAILFSILDINDKVRAQTASGLTPFTATGSSASLTSPRTTAGYDYWDHLEWCVDECAAHGMLAILIPAWYGGWGDAWRGHIATSGSDTTTATSYGAFLQTYLGDKANVWWLLGGDNGPDTTGNNTTGVPGSLPKIDVTAATNALGNTLKSNATVPQLMTYHSFRGDEAWQYFSGQSWYDLHAAYAFQDTASEVVTEWNRSTQKPVFMVEAYYAARDTMGLSTPHLSRAQLRAEAWHSILSGGFVTANGHEAVWRVDSSIMGWSTAVQAATALDLSVQSRVLRTWNTKTFLSDTNNPLISVNRSSGTSVAAGVISSDSRVAIVYIPTARTFQFNLTRMSATPGMAWVNPETGDTTQISGISGSSIELTTPSGWTDAILVAAV